MSHLIGRKRKFNGKTYTSKGAFANKKDANSFAKFLRNVGYNAIVTNEKIPSDFGAEYYVWSRRK